jgi:hypothetical protein
MPKLAGFHPETPELGIFESILDTFTYTERKTVLLL